MSNLAKVGAGYFNLSFGKFSLPVTYLEAGVVVFLIFLLILVMAQFRRHFVDWSIKGALFGTLFGFLLALTLEGFLIIGGSTALTSILGWKNPPVPISSALDAGKSKLIQVLGVSSQMPATIVKGNTTVAGAVELLQNMSPTDIKQIKTIFCQP